MNRRHILLLFFLGCLFFTGCGRFTRVYVGEAHEIPVKLELTPYRGCIYTFGIPIAGLYRSEGDEVVVKLATGQTLDFRKQEGDLVLDSGLGTGHPVVLHPQ